MLAPTLIRIVTLVPLFVAACALVGCGQRSLPAVYESGETAYTLGNYERAVADFKEYVERLPGDPKGRLGYGRALLAVGRAGEAREQLAVAYGVAPGDDEIFETYCQALMQVGAKDELYRTLRGRTLERYRFEDYLRLAAYAQKLGDYDSAELALITAARLDRGMSPAPQVALADLYLAVGDGEKALQRLKMAYYLDPNDPGIIRRVRSLHQVPGPTFGIPPSEQDAAAAAEPMQ